MINYATAELSTKRSSCSDSITLQCEMADARQQLAQYMADMQSIDAVIDSCVLALNTIDNYDGSEKQALTIINCHSAMENLLGVAESRITISAAKEGLGEALKAGWEKFVALIKAIFEKIKSWISKFINFVTGSKENTDSSAEKVKEEVAKTETALKDAAKEAEDLQKKLSNLPQAKKLTEILKVVDNSSKNVKTKSWLDNITANQVKLLTYTPPTSDNMPAPAKVVEKAVEVVKEAAEKPAPEKFKLLKSSAVAKMNASAIARLPDLCKKALVDMQTLVAEMRSSSKHDNDALKNSIEKSSGVIAALFNGVKPICEVFGIDIKLGKSNSEFGDNVIVYEEDFKNFGKDGSPKDKEYLVETDNFTKAGYTDMAQAASVCKTLVDTVANATREAAKLLNSPTYFVDMPKQPTDEEHRKFCMCVSRRLSWVQTDISKIQGALWASTYAARHTIEIANKISSSNAQVMSKLADTLKYLSN